MDYSKFITKISKKRKENFIRTLTGIYMQNPQSLFFAGGFPNADMFPFKEISVTYGDGSQQKLVDRDLFLSLQYGPSQGFSPLLKKWREFQIKWHSPKYDNWDVQATTGSIEGCSKLFEMLVEEGEPVMIQSPIYTGILAMVKPMPIELIEIGMDDDGVLPSQIIKACEERRQKGKSGPNVLYVNPTGSNPVGNVYSHERKVEIYKLAQKYDFLIMEDDPYIFMHFLNKQPQSLLSMDVDGRVLRLDSFSKLMSSGLRLGMVTAPKPIIERLQLHVQSSTIHPSSLSQVLVSKLLETWSDEDVEAHISRIQDFYKERRDEMLKVLYKHFAGIAEWSDPKGGMFVWLKVTVLDDVRDLVMKECVPQGVLILPGHVFYQDETKPCQYVRLCYSQVSFEDMEKGLSKVAESIRKMAAEKKIRSKG
ncbi:hypothetical protein QAD02_011996 [Eretmocerus hayati]|uniref:Uncharacterized protein n=1 Tax=Eretmocerus hayati TaxID=131215 RepID=A0ACC2NY41_9HYME|nr:hypothetical protein QAD02_011996 [Eretmocerus hayati]